MRLSPLHHVVILRISFLHAMSVSSAHGEGGDQCIAGRAGPSGDENTHKPPKSIRGFFSPFRIWASSYVPESCFSEVELAS